jgi:hypothetical protein
MGSSGPGDARLVVPPQGRLQFDHAPQDELPVRRVLDVSRRRDRQLLRAIAAAKPHVQSLIDAQLMAYLRFFPWPQWQQIRAMGTVVVARGARDQLAVDLAQLLRLTSVLATLEALEGFGDFVRQFRNPAQFEATAFEALMARWCVTRDVTTNVALAPQVTSGTTTRCLDFLWQTRVGDLLCECKRSEFVDSAPYHRLQRVGDVVRDRLRFSMPWAENQRLDVWFEGSVRNGYEGRIRTAFDELLRARCPLGVTFDRDDVRIRLAPRGSAPSWQGEYVTQGLLTSDVATEFEGAECDAYLGLPVSQLRSWAARHLLQQARTQLPANRTGAIFLNLPDSNAAQKRVRTLLAQPQYGRTPWIAIFTGAELRAWWQEEQPFDGRLLPGALPIADAPEAAGASGPGLFRIDPVLPKSTARQRRQRQ